MHYDPLFFCKRITSSPEEAALLLEQIFHAPEWPMLDEGTIELEEFDRRLMLRIPAALQQKAHDLLYNWHVNLPVYPLMDDLMAELKSRGYKLYLLSNAGKQFHTYSRQISAFRHLDGMVISADVKMVKPSAGIFEHLLKTYDLKADECLFIDDYKPNTDGAEAVGIQGYCYADGNITRLRRYLEDQHIL